MDSYLSFGYWVRRRRKALDLTQAELGERVGASAAMIRKIEADERRPSRELAELLAVQLELPEADRAAFLRAARDVGLIDVVAPDAAPSPDRVPSPPPSRIPAPMTSMVNRVHELATVTSLLVREDVRLVTLLGPAGIGKTRLSIQVANNLLPTFADGVWFVDLAPISDPALVLPTVAMTLGLVLVPGVSVAAQLHEALRQRQLLLILDNFEQVVDDAALEVASLLRACGRLKVLATSRTRLDVYGEHEWLLPPMSCPPVGAPTSPEALLDYQAVQLFVARAQQHRPDFALTAETAGPVADICQRMEGVPLALELAAARTRRMDVGELAVALREASGQDWHALLHTSTRDLPPRQQTLFGAIAWSYSLLAPDEREALRRLGAFAGDFDAPAAAAVCPARADDNSTSITPMLDRLADHNLINEVSRQPERWRLLEMIREFAVAQMEPGEYETARRAHARHFAERQSDWYADWLDPAYLDAVDVDLDNFRAALAYAIAAQDAPLACHLGAAMGRFWERTGLLDEGRALLSAVLGLTGETDPKARFAVLHEATILAWMQHDFAAAESLAGESMKLSRAALPPAAAAVVRNMLGRIFLEQARYDEADRVLSEAVELGNSQSPPVASSMEVIQLGEVALARGDLDRAEQLTRRGLSTVTEDQLIPYCLGWNNLAETALARGDVVAAADALRRVLPLAHLHARRMRFFLATVAGLLLAGPPDKVADVALATRLLGFVAASNVRMGDPLSPMTQQQTAARTAVARQYLGDAHWLAAWEEGQRWTPDHALGEAQRVLMPTKSAYTAETGVAL